jgi:recombination protein RecT
MAYFKLLNGFEKTIYKTKQQVEQHAKKFSQSYGSKSSPWTGHFDAMAQKTVLKELLSKYAPLSVESIQQAVQSDQAVISEKGEFNYVDNDDSAQNSALAEAIEVDQVDSEEPLQATDQQLNFITEYLDVLEPEMQENVKMMLGDGLEMELAEQIINDIKAQQKKVKK